MNLSMICLACADHSCGCSSSPTQLGSSVSGVGILSCSVVGNKINERAYQDIV